MGFSASAQCQAVHCNAAQCNAVCTRTIGFYKKLLTADAESLLKIADTDGRQPQDRAQSKLIRLSRL